MPQVIMEFKEEGGWVQEKFGCDVLRQREATPQCLEDLWQGKNCRFDP
jgi:hypothetical protein